MATSTRRFAITLNSTERLGKIEIRNKVLSLLQGLYHNFKEPRQFKVVTLSSMYWIFEKELITTLNNKYYYEDKRGITLKSFEYDWKMFCVASINIPSGKYSKIQQEMSPLNYQVVKSNIGRHLISVHHIDVFDYLSVTDNSFDFMWIDLTSPIDHVKDSIIHASNKLLDKGILVLSFPKGREKIKIANRTQFVLDILSNMELIESVDYFDTTPMCNLILKKNSNYY